MQLPSKTQRHSSTACCCCAACRSLFKQPKRIRVNSLWYHCATSTSTAAAALLQFVYETAHPLLVLPPELSPSPPSLSPNIDLLGVCCVLCVGLVCGLMAFDGRAQGRENVRIGSHSILPPQQQGLFVVDLVLHSSSGDVSAGGIVTSTSSASTGKKMAAQGVVAPGRLQHALAPGVCPLLPVHTSTRYQVLYALYKYMILERKNDVDESWQLRV